MNQKKSQGRNSRDQGREGGVEVCTGRVRGVRRGKRERGEKRKKKGESEKVRLRVTLNQEVLLTYGGVNGGKGEILKRGKKGIGLKKKKKKGEGSRLYKGGRLLPHLSCKKERGGKHLPGLQPSGSVPC